MMDLINNNPTITIAIYGAILSTIAIGWNIYNSLQDRPKINVNAKFGFMGGDITLKKHFLFITAINKGRRHVNLSSVGIRCEKNDLINIKTISLPHKLNEGESHTEWFEVEELKNKSCSFAWYKSQTGRLYKSKSIRKKINNYFNSKKNKDTKMQKAFLGELV